MSASHTEAPHEDAPSTPQAASHSGGYPGVIIEVLREMREQRSAYERAAERAARERKSERRWRMAFQAMFFGAPLLLGLLYFVFFLSATGFRWGPIGNVVGVVRIEGTIGAGERASAEKIIPALEEAFGSSKAKAIVLHIDSPGGAPVEAERISAAIKTLKLKHRKEVVAAINNMGASAAYMIALSADKIIAARYSFVGSIGAIMAPWQLDKAIARFDVAQRVYASGKLKAFLNPFTPVSPEVDQKAQELVNQMGGYFLTEVEARRGGLLKAGVDIGTGEVWPGPEAKELGLIDEVATIDDYVGTHWGGKTYDFGPHTDGLLFLARSLQGALSHALREMTMASPTLR